MTRGIQLERTRHQGGCVHARGVLFNGGHGVFARDDGGRSTDLASRTANSPAQRCAIATISQRREAWEHRSGDICSISPDRRARSGKIRRHSSTGKLEPSSDRALTRHEQTSCAGVGGCARRICGQSSLWIVFAHPAHVLCRAASREMVQRNRDSTRASTLTGGGGRRRTQRAIRATPCGAHDTRTGLTARPWTQCQ